jgi:hypothetical protein
MCRKEIKTSQACSAFEPHLLLLDQASAQQISKINLKKHLFELGSVRVQVVLACSCYFNGMFMHYKKFKISGWLQTVQKLQKLSRKNSRRFTQTI